jgi:hypothetical protein
MLKASIASTLMSKSQDTPGQQTEQQAQENSEYEWHRVGRQNCNLVD